MAKNDPLPDKYNKALQLISEGKLTYREIAKGCSICLDTFYRLVEGNYKDSERIQRLFSEKLDIIHKRLDKEIRSLVKKNKKKTQELLENWLTNQSRPGRKVPNSVMHTIVSIANALSKSTPNVEIGSFSYTKGLSPEDIYAEFKRLSGLASDRGTVQDAPKTGSGKIPVSVGSRGSITEVEEDSILPAESEA